MTPGLAAYSASKFGLWGFSNSLRLELKSYGIHVCHFCPRATDTEFQNLAEIKSVRPSLFGADSANTVANALLEAVWKRKNEHIMSLLERLLIKFYLIMPNFSERLIR